MSSTPLLRLLALAGVTAVLPAGHAGAVELELVSRTTLIAPIDSNAGSRSPRGVSADGRFAVFASSASNLVAGDSNGVPDLFLYDAQSQLLERVSVGNGGVQSDAAAGDISDVSDDGRYVVFDTSASSLAGAPATGRRVYLRDRSSGTTTLLSRAAGSSTASGDSANPRITGDGRYVVFDSDAALIAADTNNVRDVYRLDRQSGALELISISEDGRLGNADSFEAQISADGGSIAFYTWATNLVVGDTNGYWDLLLRKPAQGTLQRVSVDSAGDQFIGYPLLANRALTADGGLVLFNIYLAGEPADTNGQTDGYLYDSGNGSVRRVTLGASGTQIEGYAIARAISADGQTLMMQSPAMSLVPGSTSNPFRTFLRDLTTGSIRHVTFREDAPGSDDYFSEGTLSADGSVVFALSWTDGIVAADRNDFYDVYRQAAAGGGVQRLSTAHAGSSAAYANGHSGHDWRGMAGSEDGRWIAFSSSADNLVVGDLNGVDDVFLRDRLLGMTWRISLLPGGIESPCASTAPSVSRDGRYVAFTSCGGLASVGFPGTYEIYRYDRVSGQTELVSATMSGFASGINGDASISDDGRQIAFYSCSSALVADDTNGHCDAFVRDMDMAVTTLASRKPAGGSGNSAAFSPTVSGDGRYVLFNSAASDLVANDSNGLNDVFVFDRITRLVERVNVDSTGTQAEGESEGSAISRDGRHVAFGSSAPNLIGPANTDTYYSVFVRDRASGTTELVSRNSAGAVLKSSSSSATISADGNRVAFFSTAIEDGSAFDPQRAYRLFLYERDRHRLSLVIGFSNEHRFSWQAPLLADGDHLLFSAGKPGLTPDDGNNEFRDVFIASRLSDYLFDDGYEPAP
jgi:Tol biopolymer transport system component